MKLENMFYYVLNNEGLNIIYRIGNQEYTRARETPHHYYDENTVFFFNIWIKKNDKHKGHKFGINYGVNFDNPYGDSVIDLAENIKAFIPVDVQYLLDIDFDFEYSNITTFEEKCCDTTKYRIIATSDTEEVILYLTHRIDHNNWD